VEAFPSSSGKQRSTLLALGAALHLACGSNVSETEGSSVPWASDGLCSSVCGSRFGYWPLHLMQNPACSVIGFVLCTIPKIHHQILLVATAIVGASVVMLGADCFSTAGLKEVISHTSIPSLHVLMFSCAVLCLEHRIPKPVPQVHRP
jgi:hypothetical protein